MVELHRHHLGYQSRQHDYAIVASRDGVVLGRLDYSEFEGKPYVKGIEVSSKRMGVGTKLVVSLQEHYPDTPIEFGGLTDDGAKLLASLRWSIVENREYQEALDEIAPLETRLEYLTKKAEQIASSPHADRDAFVAECSDWNDVADRVDELRESLRAMPPSFRFVIGGKHDRDVGTDTPRP